MRQYHCSYDTIKCDKHFTDYKEAKRYLLCVLGNTPIKEIKSFNESTFILYYKNNHDSQKLVDYLFTNLSKYFYFTISIIAESKIDNHHYVDSNPNNELNINLQNEWHNLNCENLNNPLTEY
ncbi:hypothetical protein OK18_14590 [Chryseobacterium gallinarum]|uniref:Uncharacterized protein n=1 Tax=Chryseobacterium gallinarum TaxID=1324352 RepID=A0A0G3M3B8_CHRGL|nr:hypothetical protein [Chryseobacterium gallinarum]AKK73666.1 hypothetical protein OK18_14590 [Chryseobacterium gallinarum]